MDIRTRCRTIVWRKVLLALALLVSLNLVLNILYTFPQKHRGESRTSNSSIRNNTFERTVGVSHTSDGKPFIIGSIMPATMRCFSVQDNAPPPLLFSVRFLQNGAVKLRITHDPATLSYPEPWEPPVGDVILPMKEAENVTEPSRNRLGGDICLAMGNVSVSVAVNPFRLDIFVDEELVMSANAENLLKYEQHFRKIDRLSNETENECDIQVGDIIPTVGMDLSFEGIKHVYGIPEHTSPLNLKSTRHGGQEHNDNAYDQPYRLYNLDMLDYEVDKPSALYGSIPFMLGHRKGMTCGFMWNNPSETFIDVWREGHGSCMFKKGQTGHPYSRQQQKHYVTTKTHWMSESGVIESYFFPGPTPQQVFSQYAALTGFPTLPPLFSLGFHQSRFSYYSAEDVMNVSNKFYDYDIPVDVIWLDIDHTMERRYFTWNERTFPDPEGMQEYLWKQGRRMVTIVDPHIADDMDYYVYREAIAQGFFIRDSLGKRAYKGHCWPGSSYLVDFTSKHVRKWWASLFDLNKYQHSTLHLYIWIDMNEPALFNMPENSMNKTCVNFDNVEHMEWHNLYGLYMQSATFDGLIDRSLNAPRSVAGWNSKYAQRPFVLSRAFFAGTQRYGAVWTGDNIASWDHLKASIPMLLSIGLAGLPFVGADAGGFLRNPDAELYTRWMQVASFQPFFRSHAHEHTLRREPWEFGEKVRKYAQDIIKRRYSLLPYWYTLFYDAYKTGISPMRSMWVEFPDDEETFAMQEQWMVGSNLLVAPVLEEGMTEKSVYFPCGASWFDVHTSLPMGPTDGKWINIPAPLTHVPVFQSTVKMMGDPYTLVIALDDKQHASGSLYVDDGVSMAALEDERMYDLRLFNFQDGTLSCTTSKTVTSDYKTLEYLNIVFGNVVVMGLVEEPSQVYTYSYDDLDEKKGEPRHIQLVYDWSSKTLVLKFNFPPKYCARNFFVKFV